MMLTEETARALGVADRLDPRESIFGGARYFLLVRNQIPARILEPDRTWMTLAAYNVGIGSPGGRTHPHADARQESGLLERRA